MDLDLKGKVAVVTGASVGIGSAIAEGLAREGVDLALCARAEERLVQRARELGDTYGVKTLAIAADVSRADDIARIAAQTQATFGGVDILINNAGSGTNETIMEAPDDKWQYYWDLHVMAAVRLSRECAGSMRQRGGGVVLNMASICASQPLSYEPIYNVTKSALVMFSKNLATELIPDNIRVNVVNPGLVLTPNWVKIAKELTADSDRTHQDYMDDIANDMAPIKRFASPEEVANFFVFLCSPRASYCVGSTYYIDGGMLGVTT